MQTTISTTPSAKQSLSLVKNLLGTTIGAIVYLRNLFPEENFKDTNINGLALKSLKRHYTKEADELIDWIEKGVFDALEKRYLKTLIFGIFLDPNCPENLQEGYTFGFSYPSQDQFCITLNHGQKELLSLKTKQEIIRATTDILRRLLVLTQTLLPLPKNAYVTMKLFYYEDETPKDYNPPFFQQGLEDKPFYFNANPEKIVIGQVETPHHMLNISLQASDGYLKDDNIQNEKFIHPVETQQVDFNNDQMFDSQLNIPTPVSFSKKKSGGLGLVNDTQRDYFEAESCTQDLIVQLQTGVRDQENIQAEKMDYFKDKDEIPPSQQDSVISMLQQEGLHATRTRVSEIICPGLREDQKKKYTCDPLFVNQPQVITRPVECPCMVTKDLVSDFSGIKLVQCADCKKWGHSVCFGYEKFQNGDYHSCFDCSPLHNTADTASINQVALLRLGIATVMEKGIQSRNWLSNILCMKLNSLIVGLSLTVTNQLISQLQQEGFIVQKEPLSSCRRNKFAFHAVVNKTTAIKRADVFSNNYFDELFLKSTSASNSVKSVENNKRPLDAMEDDSDEFVFIQKVGQIPTDVAVSINQPKKRKVSIVKKALVVL